MAADWGRTWSSWSTCRSRRSGRCCRSRHATRWRRRRSSSTSRPRRWRRFPRRWRRSTSCSRWRWRASACGWRWRAPSTSRRWMRSRSSPGCAWCRASSRSCGSTFTWRSATASSGRSATSSWIPRRRARELARGLPAARRWRRPRELREAHRRLAPRRPPRPRSRACSAGSRPGSSWAAMMRRARPRRARRRRLRRRNRRWAPSARRSAESRSASS